MKYFMLIVAFVAFTAEASIVYRGRLYKGAKADTTDFEKGTTYKMAFRLYNLQNGGDPLYTFVSNSVPVSRDGNFEVCLEGSEVDALFTNRTVYVGLSIGDANELVPRRQILSLPLAGRADTADAIGENPYVGSLTAKELQAKRLSAGTLEVKGNLKTTSTGDQAAIQMVPVKDTALDLTGRELSVFGEPQTLSGGSPWTAPADGVAYIYTASANSAPKFGGLIRLCRRGDSISAPVTAPSGHSYGVRFYPFLTR